MEPNAYYNTEIKACKTALQRLKKQRNLITFRLYFPKNVPHFVCHGLEYHRIERRVRCRCPVPS